MSQSNLMFVGTYTRALPQNRAASEGIYSFSVDPESGRLTPTSVTGGIANPSFVALSPSGSHLYAASEIDDFADTGGGAVVAYGINAENGALTRVNAQPSHGVAPCHLSVDATGRFVLTANYGSGVVSMYPLTGDGSLEAASSVIQHEGSSVNPQRQQGPHAHSITVDPSNQFALAADLGIDKVLIYRIDVDSQALVPAPQPAISVEAGTGPRHFDFHPNRRYGYLIQEIGSVITTFAYDEESGRLETLQTVPTLPADFEGRSSTADIHVHPSGRFVYGSNRGHDSIAIFAVDEARGTLTALGHESTRGKTPRNFAIDPAGRYLYAANQDTDTIETFEIDSESGALSHRYSTPVPAPVCIKILAST